MSQFSRRKILLGGAAFFGIASASIAKSAWSVKTEHESTVVRAIQSALPGLQLTKESQHKIAHDFSELYIVGGQIRYKMEDVWHRPLPGHPKHYTNLHLHNDEVKRLALTLLFSHSDFFLIEDYHKEIVTYWGREENIAQGNPFARF